MNQANAERFAKMTFASVYPMYLAKVEKKGRTVDELLHIIEWLTGFNKNQVKEFIDIGITIETFYKLAKINPNAHLITGVICGYRVEEIKDPFIKHARYLDKLIDELAKGKDLNKILRH